MNKKSLILILVFILGIGIFSENSEFPLVDINEVSPSVIKEIRYEANHNFVGQQVDGYNAPKCYLTESAANALARVQASLLKQSLSLKVFDCYRPQQAVDHFVRWASGNEPDQTKAIYFPNIPADSLFELGYIAKRSGHSRGSTVDLAIVQLPYQPPSEFEYNCLDEDGYKYRGSELNMGTAYDCFDVRSHTRSNLLPDSILSNRMILLEAMEAEGFVNYSQEWWHFTFKPEEFLNTYFDVPIE
ncbi:MAG: M15 family metallopeptidase [Balneolaceae bacterium]|nr:M15 family metallopeptidase [Balneolaceae bacterium]